MIYHFIYSAACLLDFFVVVSKASFTKSACSLLCLDNDPVAGDAASGRPTYTGRDDFEIKFKKDDLTVTLPDTIAYDQNWSYAKFSLVRTLRDHIGVGTIVFREVHEPRAVSEEE